MAIPVPVAKNRPQMSRADVVQHLAKFNLGQYPVQLLGIRGYFKDTVGKPGVNDIQAYDDAMFIVYPGGMAPFNLNTDPSHNRPGVATLKPDTVTLYKIGLHNMKAPYKALRQFGRVTVLRDGRVITDTAAAPFYIDIHKGGITTTSSLGCQTLPLAQWPEFLAKVEHELAANKQTIIPYALIEL